MLINNISRFITLSRYYKRLGTGLMIGNLLSLILVNPAVAETELLRTLTVTGNGVENISTTLAEVNLGVEIQGATAVEVQQEVAKRTSSVIELLRAKKVTQLRTTGIRLDPNYQSGKETNQPPILVGYIGTNTVSFRISSGQVGTLLDEAVKAGASRLDGISFTATPEAIFTAKKEALRQASLNAQAKADVVLDTLDLMPEEIVKIEVDGANVNQPILMSDRQFSAAESKYSTPAIGGEQMVEASVSLQISY
jgi:uncharacterized protein